jgi:basic membrane lipoprotein Med (substrate-binding protein (PBP1-ABC) superfamily)
LSPESPRNLGATLRRLAVAVAALLAVAALAVGCGSDDDGGGDSGGGGGGEGGGGGSKLEIAQLLYGPRDDGGFNLANTAPEEALTQEFGDRVTINYIDNVPFAEEAGQIIQRQIDQGATTVVDTVGLADIFFKVCEDNPDVHCLAYGAIGEIPENTQGVWGKYWLKEYAAGQLAGRLTESNTIGFVSPLDVPFIRSIVNSFAMGCRDTNPDCQVRVVTMNEYFNPPKSSQAANSLVDAGADVLRGGIDDISYCAVAEERGVWAIAEFWDGTDQCPTQIATSTVWNWSDYMVRTAQEMLDGDWKPTGELEIVPGEELYTLGPWGPNVPEDVQSETEESFAALVSEEENPFVGPISDNKGKVRVPEGEELAIPFFFNEWDWYVEGVVAK